MDVGGEEGELAEDGATERIGERRQLVAFGPGGVLAELIGEAGFRIAPLTDADADELVTEGKAGRLVAGYRGAPAGNATRRPA